MFDWIFKGSYYGGYNWRRKKNEGLEKRIKILEKDLDKAYEEINNIYEIIKVSP